MGFEIISKITQIEPIARGVGVRDRQRLNRMYADGRRMRWRKLKGLAVVRWESGYTHRAEVHWYEGHGLGRVEEKVVKDLDRR
ncbi:MAG: hypothetical protein DYG89_22165 [Caldilinea sp. CFX5]|nr:hypothetical protein [Caldilinea sp. CFX5]